MPKNQKNKYRVVLAVAAAVALLGVDFDVDVTLRPLFGMLG